MANLPDFDGVSAFRAKIIVTSFRLLGVPSIAAATLQKLAFVRLPAGFRGTGGPPK